MTMMMYIIQGLRRLRLILWKNKSHLPCIYENIHLSVDQRNLFWSEGNVSNFDLDSLKQTCEAEGGLIGELETSGDWYMLYFILRHSKSAVLQASVTQIEWLELMSIENTFENIPRILTLIMLTYKWYTFLFAFSNNFILVVCQRSFIMFWISVQNLYRIMWIFWDLLQIISEWKSTLIVSFILPL